IPLTIAINLSKNQRFDDAQKWFHYIFDPTDDSDGPTPERFWKVKPFQFTDVKLIENILINLSNPEDQTLHEDTVNSIGAWMHDPFRPFVVARFRQSAFMFKTVMAYLDNLVDWGDTLFRQDTGESINEAAQLYILAANILGTRPQMVPKKGSIRPKTYNDIKKDLNEFSDALVDLESDIPFDSAPHPGDASSRDKFSALQSTNRTLYFCVPRNDKLLGYWDTVADRLFKIHNSLNILGIFRQLPLFAPPIDPALLARAAAVGLDIGAVISGANQPLPLVRFQFLVQKAAEICQEVKSLGNNLLSALEKEDNEALSVLRARHERVILSIAESVKYAQWQEAIKAREGVEKTFANVFQRYRYYERLLGKQVSDIKIPGLDDLDSDSLLSMKFKANEPEITPHDIDIDISQDGQGIAGGRKISSYEAGELTLLKDAQDLHDIASIMDQLSSFLGLIPQFELDVKPIGMGAGAGFGGRQLSWFFSAVANMIKTQAGQISYEASNTAKIGTYARREQEWSFQSNLAAGEITQIFKQLRAAQIREAIAQREWKNHQQQIKNAQEIEFFLNGELADGTPESGWAKKTTSKDFYAWMKREVRGLYSQCFQFAFDIAKKAERDLQQELGDPQLSFIQFNYLDGKEGLLAGEKLYMDIKRMEMAYHDLNQREYELTRQVSLLQADPIALLMLRATGRCTFSLPEELFDMGCPGHYFRRIKSVAVSLPCVTGPYTGVNCTLTLLKSSIRKSPSKSESYIRDGDDADRFSDYSGSLQSIVTSTGQNDSGLFEVNLHDERYLPFEGSGVISQWQLQLPADPSQQNPLEFDYETIADVILHIRYTAREGGAGLRQGAIANLTTQIEKAEASGSVRLFSVRHEFPSAWAKFKSTATPAELILNLRDEHYPFWSQGRLAVIKQISLFAKPNKSTKITVNISQKQPDKTVNGNLSLMKTTSLGALLSGTLEKTPSPLLPIGEFTLDLDDNSIEDLWIALKWGKTA
ncbi:MAG TPA: hypothetical protein VF300_02930, partial [Methanothrix sp.]